jgi:hypothetical protein
VFRRFKKKLGDRMVDECEVPVAVTAKAETSEPHICEDTVKLAMKEYDEWRAEVLKDWPGIVNPYRIRREEALGVFLVERAVEELPATAEQSREFWQDNWSRWRRHDHTRGGLDLRAYLLKYAFGDPRLPDISWRLLGPEAGFSTHDAAYRWLLQFIDPTNGTTEFTSEGTPVAPPKARSRKGK